ncbi:hypothetical protein EYF80_014834 [Liparis tanakae]|uniref:Uncharacterized protein n=1 Tax=Liparis tanakae TaxID=230148 RepID=A0A4Z2IA56_9TELE|nr:hypothetical protein EYF80_014834 [Liparis tanakae]
MADKLTDWLAEKLKTGQLSICLARCIGIQVLGDKWLWRLRSSGRCSYGEATVYTCGMLGGSLLCRLKRKTYWKRKRYCEVHVWINCRQQTVCDSGSKSIMSGDRGPRAFGRHSNAHSADDVSAS